MRGFGVLAQQEVVMQKLMVLALVVVSQVASAQAVRNGVERVKDRQDLRQDRRQGADDRLDAARAQQLLGEYDQAIAANNPAKLTSVESRFSKHLAQEIAESRVESVQARQEVREDKREVRSDRREVGRDVASGKGPAVVADDLRDKTRDRVNTIDDRVDAAKERGSRERMVAIQSQTAALAGRFDPGSLQQKRALYAEVVGIAANEVHRDNQETREDHRELREDRRETREDRRQR